MDSELEVRPETSHKAQEESSSGAMEETVLRSCQPRHSECVQYDAVAQNHGGYEEPEVPGYLVRIVASYLDDTGIIVQTFAGTVSRMIS